jgi:hypothetical protein
MTQKLLSVLVACALSSQAMASESILREYPTTARGILSGLPAISATQPRLQTSENPLASSTGTYQRKSPAKAFFLSLVLPGLGELYTGHAIRGAAFLAVEGTAWGLWSNFHGNGQDWEKKYIDYQAAHWNFERYDAYRHAVWDRVGQITNFWDVGRPLSSRQQDSLTVLVGAHHYDDCCGQTMPAEDDRLEMIGKYYAFSYGWDDATVYNNSTKLLSTEFPDPRPAHNGVWGLDKQDWISVLGGVLVTPVYDDSTFVFQVPNLNLVTSVNREEYMTMRQKANNSYSNAEKMVTVILFNHIISAIHAARLASSMNSSGGGAGVQPTNTSLRMALQRTDRDMVPMLVLWRRF